LQGSDERINSVAEELSTSGARVKPVQVDLATDEGVDELYERLDRRPVSALALNAGIGAGGAFATDSGVAAARADGGTRDGARSAPQRSRGHEERPMIGTMCRFPGRWRLAACAPG